MGEFIARKPEPKQNNYCYGAGNCPFYIEEGKCKMEKLMDKVNLIGGGIVAILSAVFGQLWFLFAGLLVLNVVDWLSGWKAAAKLKKSDSKVGAKGVAKKVWYWIIIAVSFYIGFAFEKLGAVLGVSLGFMNMIGWFVLANYLVNEIRSITENAVKLGADVPGFLIKGLKITGNLIDHAADTRMPQSDEKERIQ